jgi:hypothetical protein
MSTPKLEVKPSDAPVLIQLGRQRRKRVRELLRGEGKLFDEVTASIEELKANGTLPATAHPVIVVVRERPRKTVRGLFG